MIETGNENVLHSVRYREVLPAVHSESEEPRVRVACARLFLLKTD